MAELVARGCEVHYYLAAVGMRSAVEAAGAQFVLWDDFVGRGSEVMAEEADWLQSKGFP